ncbi:MAG: M16 family metallopeptidase [Geitlerinemataceae cyanobacterium]
MTSVLLPRPTEAPLNAPVVRQLECGAIAIAEQIPVEAVNLNLWLDVGAAVEPDEIDGMAHFLEHMVFKGTPRLAMGEFEQRIEARGAVTNAATSQDYTHYYFTCAPQDFASLAPLQFDVVLNPSLDADAFDRERHVVLEEIRRSADNPRRRNFRRVSELAFETLPYRRPVLGRASTIAQLPVEAMREFHRTWYHPEALTVAVVGNLPVEELLAIATESCERALAGRPAVARGQRRELGGERPFERIERFEAADPGLQQARLSLVWRVPGLNAIEQIYALDVLASVLGQGRTGRLVRRLREERGLVSGIGAGNLSYRMQGLFQVNAQLPAENIEEVEAEIVRAIAEVRETPIDREHIDRVRKKVANRYIFGNERPSDRANLYGYSQTLTGGLEAAFGYTEALQAISAEDLREMAQRYLRDDAYGVVAVRPESA